MHNITCHIISQYHTVSHSVTQYHRVSHSVTNYHKISPIQHNTAQILNIHRTISYVPHKHCTNTTQTPHEHRINITVCWHKWRSVRNKQSEGVQHSQKTKQVYWNDKNSLLPLHTPFFSRKRCAVNSSTSHPSLPFFSSSSVNTIHTHNSVTLFGVIVFCFSKQVKCRFITWLTVRNN